MLRPDGTVHWVESEAGLSMMTPGKPARMLGVCIDIEERRRAQGSTFHWAAIVESSNDAIIGETLEGRIISWNPAAERLFGYSAAEIQGQPISVLLPPDHRAEELSGILVRLKKGGAQRPLRKRCVCAKTPRRLKSPSPCLQSRMRTGDDGRLDHCPRYHRTPTNRRSAAAKREQTL